MIEDLWYKNAVIYHLDVESFVDSNGDGVGDFEGLVRRLDYIETLGVDVLWIAPFYATPNRDNGYDVSDYYAVDPRLGTLGELVELVHQAKKRGLKVIMDLVVNHSSDEHPWFQRSRAGDPKYADWYVWSKKRPPNWDKGMVFPGVQRSTWTRDAERGEYYFHRFYEFEPDLNIDNPAVRTEIRRIMGFWLQLGVDGFRIDAVPFLIEHPSPGDPSKPTKMHFDYLEELREFSHWRSGPTVLLGEANVLPDESREYFRDGRGIQMMFNFWVNQHLFYALATGEVAELREALTATRELPHSAQWAQFLRNHDELDLGRLSDEQRATVFERFAPDPSMQLYGRGIRRRLAPMLGNRPHQELAYSMCFALPGTPVLRYGDEIGMGDHLELKERIAVRTPMQWSGEPQAGFSTAEDLVHPVIDFGVYDYHHVNVENQRRDPDSMLRWTIRLIRVRKECPEIGWGRWEILETGSPHVLAMRYDWRGTSVVTLHNFDDHPHDVSLRVGVPNGDDLFDLWAPRDSHAGDEGVHDIAIEAYGYRWYRVGDLNYALRRRAEEPTLEQEKKETAPKRERAEKTRARSEVRKSTRTRKKR
ncbi:MAG: alpha-amylase family protein [Myxococcota bacterium]|nr:alpha-amylase family protein [Myxococcota bacterium]